MNSKTFSFVVLLKWFELGYKVVTAALMIIATLQLHIEVDAGIFQGDIFYFCLVLSYTLCTLAVYNIAYNTLLTNMRFVCKAKCMWCCGGGCCFEIWNLLFCFDCLKKCCRDDRRSQNKTFYIKWII